MKKKAAKKKRAKTMDELTKGYEKFIKGKKTNKTGKKKFEKALKNASKPRSSKRSQT